MAERRGRLAEGEAVAVAGAVAAACRCEDAGDRAATRSCWRLRHSARLTAYDAAYLALAIAKALPLATLRPEIGRRGAAGGVAVRGPLASAP